MKILPSILAAGFVWMAPEAGAATIVIGDGAPTLYLGIGDIGGGSIRRSQFLPVLGPLATPCLPGPTPGGSRTPSPCHEAVGRRDCRYGARRRFGAGRAPRRFALAAPARRNDHAIRASEPAGIDRGPASRPGRGGARHGIPL